MNTWFEVTVKYEKIDEEGRQKKATEKYLLDAVSFTEAEARIYKELETMISGEFTITKIQKSNIQEVVPSENGNIWFKCKLNLLTIDESTGKAKKASQYILVLASDVPQAHERLQKNMEGVPVDYEITAVTDPGIWDVFPYAGSEDIPDNITAANS